MIRLFDLSQPLFDHCPNCPEHPPVEVSRIADHPTHGWRLEMLHMASHSGTHLDAPLHKLAGGASIDAFPLEAFTGPARVFDVAPLGAGAPLGAHELERAPGAAGSMDAQIALIHTGWGLQRAASDAWLHHAPYLTPEGAEWLVRRKVKGVGIDHFSIGGSRTHEILLGAGVWIVEDLLFPEGWREAAANANFQALPLLLPGCSGAPCRAVFVLPA